ncbi:MAG: nickel pincer cofactor biosynthesis protein LarB [Actinomycetota bacterium]|nr:nickel pincer cofactor biosynthesis protein LarB [Actinomycetota bacterium]
MLGAVRSGQVSIAAAAAALRDLPFADLGDLKLDHHRELRTGDPEVVFGEGKTADQCARAVQQLLRAGDGPVLVTRVSDEQAAAVHEVAPAARHDEVGRVVVARRAAPAARVHGVVTVACAGTSDLPVAQECATVLDAFGVDVTVVADVGVAGVHRLLAVRDRIDTSDVAVVVAGMEGALPSLVAGLVAAPVVAVPTSVGYGASFDGLAALLGMLTACAPGIAVVNIDGGFAAAMVTLRMLRLAGRTRHGRKVSEVPTA